MQNLPKNIHPKKKRGIIPSVFGRKIPQCLSPVLTCAITDHRQQVLEIILVSGITVLSTCHRNMFHCLRKVKIDVISQQSHMGLEIIFGLEINIFF